jgi:hypothetical protein
MFGKKIAGATDESKIEEGLFICALRGMDSVGVGVVPADLEEAAYVSKRVGSPPFYFKLPDKGAQCVIGHVRSATIGHVNRETAHPFIFDNIIGAHNGTLRGDWREQLQWGTNEVFASDSQAVFYNFAYYGVQETISRIYGAWCFVWWDDDEQTLNMLRNDERPMWLARGKDGNLYWASEYWMIQGMVRAGEKDRTKFEKWDDGRFFTKLPTNVWRKWQLDEEGTVVQLEDIPLEGKPEPVKEITVQFDGFTGERILKEMIEDLGIDTNNFGKNGTTNTANDDGEFYYVKWDIKDQKWAMCGQNDSGAMRVPNLGSILKSKEEEKKQGNGIKWNDKSGKLWRNVAGVAYVCAPGSHEIKFRELLEYRTDGSCHSCGTFFTDPREIGHLAKDYSFAVCTNCCKDWFDNDWQQAMDKQTAVSDNDDIPWSELGIPGVPPMEANSALFLDVQALELPLDDPIPDLGAAVLRAPDTINVSPPPLVIPKGQKCSKLVTTRPNRPNDGKWNWFDGPR